MVAGQLHTNRSWNELLSDVVDEFRLWRIRDYHLPYKRDSEREGAVTITFVLNGKAQEVSCNKFQDYRPMERNLAALLQVIRATRLADQRGILHLLADISGKMALPDPTDYHRVLGVSKDATQEEVERGYRVMVRKYHPDNPQTGNRIMFDMVKDAAEKLGVA